MNLAFAAKSSISELVVVPLSGAGALVNPAAQWNCRLIGFMPRSGHDHLYTTLDLSILATRGALVASTSAFLSLVAMHYLMTRQKHEYCLELRYYFIDFYIFSQE